MSSLTRVLGQTVPTLQSSDGRLALRPQDAWDTSVTISVLGEDVRFFHTKKSGVERIWVDRCRPGPPS